ncbi:MAG: site-specific DNA-methyltransferase, partial [Phycisphaerae bacterium]|nr:site-specific DNA-methyltransferase [Phycisphaerae bacterium]
VLDPFSGSGTTCVVAARLKRHYIGIDISADYVRQSRKRIAETLAGRRQGTEIAENPEALRDTRGKKQPVGGRCGEPQGRLAKGLFDGPDACGCAS